MLRISYALLSALLAVTLLTCSSVSVQAADQQEQPLLEVLQSDAAPAEKAITCKQLAVYGTPESVPALAALLPDPELASWARIALEVIPGAAADEALREAMKDLDGRLLIGVINSIGVRRDAQAVNALAERLNDSDPDVAAAAAVTLGKIADEAAIAQLQQTLPNASPDIRSSVAQGCLLSAESLMSQGKNAAAAQLYDQVRETQVSQQRFLEATRGAILARGSEGVPLLLELLQSTDQRNHAMGLSVARELQGETVTGALLTEIERTSPQRQANLLLALADRGDASSLPAVLSIAKNGSTEARTAALNVVRRLGDASCVADLLEIAAEDDAEVAQAAKATLENLPGQEVNDALVARMDQAQGKVRRVLLELVGLRRIPAVPALLKAADDPDDQIRVAALAALGETVGLEDLDVLLNRVVKPSKGDTAAATQALRAASVRMPDREACAEKLATAMEDAPLDAQRTILESLSAMGGPRALQAMRSAAMSAQPELQDTASQLLGGWMTVDAGPVLLELAKTADDGRYQVRAVRGYIRLARQFTMPEEDRVTMCREAMQVAQRDVDKKLVLEVLERYPSRGTLKLAIEAAKDPALKDDAERVTLAIAQAVGGTSDVQELLKLIGQTPVRLEIVKAEYGSGNQWTDVTSVLQKHEHDLPLIVLPSTSYNASFGGDPTPSVRKQLKIQYRIDGKASQITLPENAAILLPKP